MSSISVQHHPMWAPLGNCVEPGAMQAGCRQPNSNETNYTTLDQQQKEEKARVHTRGRTTCAACDSVSGPFFSTSVSRSPPVQCSMTMYTKQRSS